MYTFRSAVETDYPEICKLIKSREELLWVYPAGRYPLTVSQLEDLAQKRIELTVAIVDGKVAGFADFYDLQLGKTVFIGNLIVGKKYRGYGLGKSLVVHMTEKAFEKYEVPEVRLSVYSENSRALLLYSRLGFVPYAIDERVKSDGQRLALIHMRMMQ